MNKGFFYCYDYKLKNFLSYKKGIRFICHGLNVRTGDPFWQFEKSDDLQDALNKYKKMQLSIV
ncbi:hypothetical protein BSK66_26690 [Paenibacillus odorifer]|uniref:hypothetical protein n=1 Tax=Paenibacillus TaxID=44249 RepID=UPI0003E1FDFB|nr:MULTISPECIES: hypothetical protein [Paenibacillus]ETT49336.1 hypothetical protein C171_23725 [Paenibacillus sp. FSL H8-237]OME49548.1 hypothetical protein BSK66_26690 [Paenibacillus odorifer]